MLTDKHYISRLKSRWLLLRWVNKSPEDAVRFNMFERDIRGKKMRKLILELLAISLFGMFRLPVWRLCEQHSEQRQSSVPEVL